MRIYKLMIHPKTGGEVVSYEFQEQPTAQALPTAAESGIAVYTGNRIKVMSRGFRDAKEYKVEKLGEQSVNIVVENALCWTVDEVIYPDVD